MIGNQAATETTIMSLGCDWTRSEVRVGRPQSRRDVDARAIRSPPGSRQIDLFGYAKPEYPVAHSDTRDRAAHMLIPPRPLLSCFSPTPSILM